MRTYRSHLMFPADELPKYAKAIASGADAVSADLEDSIPPNRKQAARETLLEWLKTNSCPTDFHVRINKGSDDFTFLEKEGVLPRLACIVMPKVEYAQDILDVTKDFPVFAIIEEAMGVLNMESIIALPNVKALMLGRSDMSRALGLTDRLADLDYIRQRMAIAAHAYGKQSLDCCHIVKDTAYVYKTWRESASFGITGGACVHTSQVAIAKEIFTPSQEVVDWCRGANAGYQSHEGRAYIDSKDGGIVGLPHKRAADRILDK